MDIKIWQDKIKQKRKQTEFRQFLKEIVSWCPIVFNKNSWYISRYPQTDRIKWLIPLSEFEENRDLVNKNDDYDFNLDFFQNFQKIFQNIKFPPHISHGASENTDFTDTIIWSKNVYLSTIVVAECENVLYSFQVVQNSTNIFNCIFSWDNSSNLYMCNSVFRSYNVFFSKYLDNCADIRFCSNLIWCKECIFCDGLENKSYCIDNKEYTKDEFFIRKQEILKNKQKFMSYFTSMDVMPRNYWAENCTWQSVTFSKSVENAFLVEYVNNGRNVVWCWWESTNLYDTFDVWIHSNDVFAIEWWWYYSQNIYCGSQVENCSNVYYSYFMNECSFCLGCVWLKNKSYCILNKQYSEAERYDLVEKIFKQMEEQWILWEFFPWYINPFYFNDTIAYVMNDSFSKNEVENQWYLRRDEAIKVDIPVGLEVVKTEDLNKYQWFNSEWKWNINPEILKKVIKDEKWDIYRIVNMEYEFLKKYELPLPDLHWLNRMKLHFKSLNIDLK